MRFRRGKPGSRRNPIVMGVVPEALGRRGVCPFCHYIGPPQLCACVTDLRQTLAQLAMHLPITSPAHELAHLVLAKDQARVNILNEELRKARER